MMTYRKPTGTKDLREAHQVILARGEATGHHHAVVVADVPTVEVDDLPAADYFEEPSGRRVLLITRPCVLQHPEHGALALDPAVQTQVRQGDVLLRPLGPGAWEVVRQREYSPEAIRSVVD